MFREIDGTIILTSRGVYREAKLGLLEGRVYAKHGTGYVLLFSSGSTTAGKITWRRHDEPPDLHAIRCGYLGIAKPEPVPVQRLQDTQLKPAKVG